MKLLHPFMISPRLMPALDFKDAWFSYDWEDGTVFWLDMKETNQEHKIEDYHPPQAGQRGAPHPVQGAFEAILSFMMVALESRQNRVRQGKAYDPDDQDSHEHLFTKEVLDWVERNEDEIQILQSELETPGLVSEED